MEIFRGFFRHKTKQEKKKLTFKMENRVVIDNVTFTFNEKKIERAVAFLLN